MMRFKKEKVGLILGIIPLLGILNILSAKIDYFDLSELTGGLLELLYFPLKPLSRNFGFPFFLDDFPPLISLPGLVFLTLFYSWLGVLLVVNYHQFYHKEIKFKLFRYVRPALFLTLVLLLISSYVNVPCGLKSNTQGYFSLFNLWTSGSAGEGVRNSCYLQKAKAAENVELCSKIDNRHMGKQCYSALAFKTADPDLCTELALDPKESYSQNGCYYLVALKNYDYKIMGNSENYATLYLYSRVTPSDYQINLFLRLLTNEDGIVSARYVSPAHVLADFQSSSEASDYFNNPNVQQYLKEEGNFFGGRFVVELDGSFSRADLSRRIDIRIANDEIYDPLYTLTYFTEDSFVNYNKTFELL